MEIQFSIIVPTYNRAELLMKTLDSLVQQSYPQFEVLIIDDGSTDETSDKIQSYLSDPRFHYFKLSNNMGESYAVNFGWNRCNYRYVSIVNSDDPQIVDWLEQMSRGITMFPNYGFFYPNRITIDESGQIKSKNEMLEFSKSLMYGKMICIASAGLVIDKFSLPENYILRDESVEYPSDLIQMFELGKILNGVRIGSAWGVWRDHRESISRSRGRLELFKKYERSVLAWLLANEEYLRSQVPIGSSFCYLYAQLWILIREEFGVLRSLTILINSSFLSVLFGNPSTVFFIAKVFLQRIFKLFA